MKFGNFHDEGGSYFGSLGLEDNSKSDNRVLFFAPGSTEAVLYEGEHALPVMHLFADGIFQVY